MQYEYRPMDHSKTMKEGLSAISGGLKCERQNGKAQLSEARSVSAICPSRSVRGRGVCDVPRVEEIYHWCIFS